MRIVHKLTVLFIAVPAIIMVISYFLITANCSQSDSMNRWIISIGMVTIFALGFSGIFLSRSILKPIKELKEFSNKIAKGNLSEPVTIRGNDEIGELAESFDNMRYTLKMVIDEYEKVKGKEEIIARLKETMVKQKATEEALKENEVKYRFLVDNSKDLILIISKEGNILFVNKAVSLISGFSENEIVGHSIKDFLTKDSGQKAAYQLQQEFSGKPQPEAEVEFKAKSGDLRYLELSKGSTQVYEKGNMIGILISAHDVTERKKSEEQLKRKTSQLEKFARLVVGREEKMIELKREISRLKNRKKE